MSQEQISQDYNEPSLRSRLLSGSVGVGEDPNSLYKRRLDSDITAVELIPDANASYRVIDGQYLVPQEGMRFNPMNFDTFQALYNFPEDFTPDKYPTAQEFKLASPAKVVQTAEGYTLIEKGRFVSPELIQQRSNQSESEQIRPRIVEPQINNIEPQPSVNQTERIEPQPSVNQTERIEPQTSVNQPEPAAAQVVNVRAETVPITPSQSNTPTLSEDQYRYLDLAGQSDSRIESITNRILSDPNYGKQLDQSVIRAAESAKVSPEDLTRILSNGLNVQTMREQGASSQEVRSYIAPLDSAYRNRELEALNQSLSDKVTDTLKTGYAVLKTTEKAAFAVTPLPLESAKSVIQKAGLPLAATALTAQMPIAHQVVQTAIRIGGDMVSTASVAVAGNALAHFGQSVMSNLPSGLGIRSMAGGLGEAVTPVMTNIARTSGQAIGQAGAAIMTGNAIIKSGTTLATALAEKGPKVFFSEAFERGQQILERARTFTQGLVDKVQSLRGQNKMETNQTLENNAIGPDITDSNSVAPQNNGYDLTDVNSQVASDAIAARETTEQTEPIVQPIDATAEEQDWQDWQDWQDREQDREQDEIETTANVQDQELANTEDAFENSQVPFTQGVDPTEDAFENSQVPLTQGVDLSRENMDYALSLEQQLSQSNIDTQRLEISFNGTTVFKMADYAVTKNNLNNEAVEMLKQAMNDPANLKGEVMIKQGTKVLLHVKDGQVLRDAIRLTHDALSITANSPQPANTTTQALYENASANVPLQGLEQIREVSKNAYRAGAQVEQVLDMNRQYNPEYKKQVDKIGSDAVDGVVRQAQTKVALEQQPQKQSSLQNKSQQKMS